MPPSRDRPPDGGYAEKVWVLGSNIPIWPTPGSVNQRLPSAPNAMAEGSAPAVGRVNSVIAPLVGLIVPILSAPLSVNQS